MKKRSILLTILGLVFAIQIQAQDASRHVATGGMSPELLERIDNHIQKYIAADKVPGGVFHIERKGQVVYHKSFGESGEGPYQNDHIFRLASMTKAITTVSIMQLYENGLVGLDDPIHKHIPAFKDQLVIDTFEAADSSFTTVPAERAITIRMLLTHTSGIVYGDFNPGKLQAIHTKLGLTNVGLSHPTWNTEQLVDKIASVPLAFQPGSKYSYGLNMEVLGRIVEVASGKSLRQYFKDHIFGPLGMNSTDFNLSPKQAKKLVPVYTYKPDGKFMLIKDADKNMAAALEYPRMPDSNHYAGGGGLSGTAADYAKFIAVLGKGGRADNGYRLLGRKALEVMTSDQLIMQNAMGTGFSKIPGVTYGLGFALRTGAGVSMKSVGTFEWGGVFNTKYFIDPAEELTFVGMTQTLPFPYNEFWEEMYQLIYSSIDD